MQSSLSSTRIFVFPFNGYSSVKKPIKEKARIAFGSLTVSSNVPSIRVVVPFVVPFSTIFMPGAGSFSPLIMTVPVMGTWPQQSGVVRVNANVRVLIKGQTFRWEQRPPRS